MFIYSVSSCFPKQQTHKMKKQPKALFSKAKLFFFSALLAFCQRNNHFSGCKGTDKLWNTQHFLRFQYKDLSFFILSLFSST